MKAILYKNPSGAVLCDTPTPEIGPGEALIAVDACGLCGTDIMKLSIGAETAVLGHELAGRIVKLGRGAKGFGEGDRVVVAHHVPCLDCHYCRRKSFSMCRQFKSTNIDPGGFAEYVRVPALHVSHTMLKLPEGLSALAASQTEPLACCLRNAKRLKVRAGDTVGIVGLGAIGMMMAQLLKPLEVDVFGLDLDVQRAAALAPWGKGFSQAPALEAEFRTATSGRGLDALIFTAGTPALVSDRLGWIRDGGTLNVFAGFHPQSRMSLDLNAIYHRELTVVSSYSPALEDLTEALALIASGAFAGLPAKSYGLQQFDEALQAVRSRQIMKAILVPR